jgi:uncharacterized DUF497 family protein
MDDTDDLEWDPGKSEANFAKRGVPLAFSAWSSTDVPGSNDRRRRSLETKPGSRRSRGSPGVC